MMISADEERSPQLAELLTGVNSKLFGLEGETRAAVRARVRRNVERVRENETAIRIRAADRTANDTALSIIVKVVVFFLSEYVEPRIPLVFILVAPIGLPALIKSGDYDTHLEVGKNIVHAVEMVG